MGVVDGVRRHAGAKKEKAGRKRTRAQREGKRALGDEEEEEEGKEGASEEEEEGGVPRATVSRPHSASRDAGFCAAHFADFHAPRAVVSCALSRLQLRMEGGGGGGGAAAGPSRQLLQTLAYQEEAGMTLEVEYERLHEDEEEREGEGLDALHGLPFEGDVEVERCGRRDSPLASRGDPCTTIRVVLMRCCSIPAHMQAARREHHADGRRGGALRAPR